MGFNFPNSPIDGASFVPPGGSGMTYVWNAATGAWKLSMGSSGGGGASIYVGDTPPASPTANQLWWRSDLGQLFLYYSDPNTTQWVQAAGSATGQIRNTARTRNRVNNPTMQISQENGTTAVTATGTYPADQWLLGVGGIVGQAQRATLGTPTLEGTITAVSITATTAKASLVSGDNLHLIQPIEGVDVADFGWGTASAKPVVLRFNVLCQQTGTFPIRLSNSANDRCYCNSYTVVTANVWQTVSFAVPGDVTGTWLNNTGIGLTVDLGYALGPNFVGVAGWQAGSFYAPPGMTNGAAVANSKLYVTDVGLYLDPDNTGVAPRFEVPSFEDDLARCMRYWQPINISQRANAVGAGVLISVPIQHSPMRTTPSNGVLTAGGVSNVQGSAPSLTNLNNVGGRSETVSAGSGDFYVLQWVYKYNARLI
jgi:hypothetical protein